MDQKIEKKKRNFEILVQTLMKIPDHAFASAL